MPENYETESERVFAGICQGLGYPCSKLPTDANRQTPDFRVLAGERVIFAEVKQFDENEEHLRIEGILKEEGGHVAPVDFNHDGGLSRKVNRQAAQLRAKSEENFPTLSVIYSRRVLGPTDYQVHQTLSGSQFTIPPKISAVLLVRNENLIGATPVYEVFTRGC